ncbi:MAG TPA: mycofactocin system transcriptional regulator [Acidimicrobiales bacterium]|nr:mycofactocin system transcriptional regulator [Acidimicrobiales bacterium]
MPKWKRDDRGAVTAVADDDGGGSPEPARGRPASTSRPDVARAALDLFARQGYDETTVDEIAAAVGISRRTFFRYFESKPDVVWGEFDVELGRLRDRLAEAPADEPLLDVLRRSVMATNRFGAGELDELRIRMVLIGTVPTLVAHSAVRYEEWCDVVAGFAASRLGGSPDDLAPQTVARAALGAAMAAFACWARDDAGDLVAEVDRAFRLLSTGFDGTGPVA